mmetsp:Transcript_37234/g.88239  ORF Transcript_37234/g.88239 Transcript_37234/m.88239 type:complete len:884 (+) Transcript_37234:142-2793(+)
MQYAPQQKGGYPQQQQRQQQQFASQQQQFQSIPMQQQGGQQYQSQPRQPMGGGQPQGRQSMGGQQFQGQPQGRQSMGGQQFASQPAEQPRMPPQQFASQPAPPAQYTGAQSQQRQVGGTVEDNGLAGVGLFFQQMEQDTERVYVKNILAMQSADREGTVLPGDVIEEVDGQAVSGSALAELRSKILGEIGTFVTLRFLREGDDGEMYAYTVSLMRGNAAYYALLRDKFQMQEDVEKLRVTLTESEEHLNRLRKELNAAEEASGASMDKATLEQLRVLLRQAEEALRLAQAQLKQEHMARRELEARAKNIGQQRDQDARDLDQLRGWLNQAQDKLAAAHESLKMTRQQKAEQDERYREEQAKRVSTEEQERKLMQEAEERMEEDRRQRETRETELLALEEERRKYEKLYRDETAAVMEIVRKREIIEARVAKSDAQRAKIHSDNDRLMQMLREAEEARTTIEQAKKDTEEKNVGMEEEILLLEEEARKGAAYIEELKEKLEQERVRWEAALRQEQDGRKEDNMRYKVREDELLAQIAKVTEETRRFKEEAEDKRRKLETAVMRLEQENKSLEAALKAEESLAEALRERLSVLGEQVGKTEVDLAALSVQRGQTEEEVKEAETAKLKALERERAMDAELIREKQAEPEKLEAIENLKRSLEEKRLATEKALHDEMAQERATLVSKEEAEHALRRFRDDGQLMVDNERRRLEREVTFKKSHEEYVAQFDKAFSGQAELGQSLKAIKLPSKELEKYLKDAHIFDDTDPKTVRTENVASLHHQNGTGAFSTQGGQGGQMQMQTQMHHYQAGGAPQVMTVRLPETQTYGQSGMHAHAYSMQSNVFAQGAQYQQGYVSSQQQQGQQYSAPAGQWGLRSSQDPHDDGGSFI